MDLTGRTPEVANTNAAAGQRFLRDCGTSHQSSSREMIGRFPSLENLSGRVSQSVCSLDQTLRPASETVSDAGPQTADGAVDLEA